MAKPRKKRLDKETRHYLKFLKAQDLEGFFSEEMADGLPGCGGVVKVAGAHAANLTNPDPVNAAILDFLADLPA